jgi:hypothetical protein
MPIEATIDPLSNGAGKPYFSTEWATAGGRRRGCDASILSMITVQSARKNDFLFNGGSLPG